MRSSTRRRTRSSIAAASAGSPAPRAGRHAGALRAAFAQAGGRAEAVGHRVVHGGARFDGPARVDAEARAAIAALAPLAPLHTRAALEGIDAASEALPGVPQVACFDTAFHRTLPPAATTYALPRAWSERFELRRYGFHGLNVAWCTSRRRGSSAPSAAGGSSSAISAAAARSRAVLDGRSVDTTMGFTPLDGVPMATRSGSLDPGLVLHLLAAGIARDELDEALNHRSGLLGIAGARRPARGRAGGDRAATSARSSRSTCSCAASAAPSPR